LLKRCIFSFIFLQTLLTYAQDRLGISHSNFSPSNAIFLNPAASVDSRAYMQLNVIGVNSYVRTNFGYLPDFKMPDVIRLPMIQRAPTNFKTFLFANAELNAPGFIMSKRTYGLGFFIRARAVVDARRIPFELATALANGAIFDPKTGGDLMGQNFKNAKLSTLVWEEYGINFAKMITRERDILIALGGNLKYLSGANMNYQNILAFNSYKNTDGTYGVSNLEAKIISTDTARKAGRGFGIDFGITYKIMQGYVDKYYANSKQSNCKQINYEYKFSLALRDLGYIRFKGKTSKTEAIGSGFYDPYTYDTTFVDALQKNFKSTVTLNQPVTASLPTSLVGSAEKNFNNFIYVNVTLIKNLVPARLTGVQGPDLLSICPRLETKNIEVALPLTLEKFIYPQMGFALRLRGLTVGTDNIKPYLLRSNTNAASFYFSLTASLYSNPQCKTKRIKVSDCVKFKKTGKNKTKNKKLFPLRKRHKSLV
jgi:hypothetical protein